jgi:uncharacterized protein
MPLIVSWMNPKLEVCVSNINERGIWTREHISKDERLAIWGGDIMRIDEIGGLPAELQKYPLQIEERFVIWMRNGATAEDSDYFNHSCNPNSGIKGQIFLVAMRDIQAGEEIVFDYAMVLSDWVESSLKFEMECRCNSDRCRKKVTQNDWKLPELQKKYKGYFSSYLEEKIQKEYQN